MHPTIGGDRPQCGSLALGRVTTHSEPLAQTLLIFHYVYTPQAVARPLQLDGLDHELAISQQWCRPGHRKSPRADGCWTISRTYD